jgi:hypothetical protein
MAFAGPGEAQRQPGSDFGNGLRQQLHNETKKDTLKICLVNMQVN